MNFYDVRDIRAKMKERKYTSVELSKEIGMSNNALHNILKEKAKLDNIKLGTYKSIVNKLWKE